MSVNPTNKDSENMSNDLVETKTNLPATNFNPFTQHAEDLGAQDSGMFLRFSGNDGTYTYGPDDDVLEDGHQLALSLHALARGWICWKDGQVIDEVMVPIMSGEPAPDQDSLPDHSPYEGERDGWQQQAYLHLRSLVTGDEFKLKLSNKSSMIAFGNLLQLLGRQFGFHQGETPIIAIGSSSFPIKDKKTGKKLRERKYAPVLKVVGWKTESELEATLAKALENSRVADDQDDDDLEPAKPAAKGPNNASRRGRAF